VHPIVIYELVRTRMELDRQAERRRRAQAVMPHAQPARARVRRPGKGWLGRMSFWHWVRVSSRDRSQPSRTGNMSGSRRPTLNVRRRPVG